MHKEFYTDDRPHLRDLCDKLQLFYEGKLLKPDGTPKKKFMINMPPRFGKTRTLVLFCMWTLGLLVTNRIIACSFNNDMASDFSRYTRDGINAEAGMPHDIAYSDIFPETRISDGNASYQKWALEGQFFSYKGAGIGGSITGKGATIAISDDLIKDAEEAYNANLLDKKWLWYTGTFLSRLEEGALEIMNGTRWAKLDPCGRIMASEKADDWYVLKMEVCDRKDPESPMLCPDLMSRKSYEDKKALMDEAIFWANYHQEPIDIKGRMYTNITTYERLPQELFEQRRCYIDTADTGGDYLCAIAYGVLRGEAWVLGVLYTKKGMEYTEPDTARFLVEHGIDVATIESNNGGMGFARAVKRLLWEKHKTKQICINTFHQGRNKDSRILSKSNYVMQHIFLPYDWKSRYPAFYTAITTHQKEGQNEHDDAADTLTGVAENIDKSTNNIAEVKSLASIGVY